MFLKPAKQAEYREREKSVAVGVAGASRGFTVIEIIVVSAIVLVLAAVAIPIYTGYVDSTRREAVSILAQTGAAAASSYYKKTEKAPASPILPNSAPLSLFFNGNKYSVVTVGSFIYVTDRSNAGYTASVAFR